MILFSSVSKNKFFYWIYWNLLRVLFKRLFSLQKGIRSSVFRQTELETYLKWHHVCLKIGFKLAISVSRLSCFRENFCIEQTKYRSSLCTFFITFDFFYFIYFVEKTSVRKKHVNSIAVTKSIFSVFFLNFDLRWLTMMTFTPPALLILYSKQRRELQLYRERRLWNLTFYKNR